METGLWDELRLESGPGTDPILLHAGDLLYSIIVNIEEAWAHLLLQILPHNPPEQQKIKISPNTGQNLNLNMSGT